jgi:methionyl-tRNA synthetase
MIREIESAKSRIEGLLEQYKFREALFEVIDLSRKGNKYMQEKEPWIVARTLAETPANQGLIDNCLHICLQLSANLAILINPFLPFTAKKMLHMMKVVEKMLDWDNAGKMNLLSVGYSLRAPELLFRKIEDEEVQYQVDKLLKAKAAAAARAAQTDGAAPDTAKPSGSQSAKAPASGTAPAKAAPAELPAAKPTIVYDDFAKLDLKVGTILQAEKVEKADKLLKLTVDMGTEKRTIVSGIALHFNPSDIVGRQVVVVANLAPRKMRGIESNGMILMAEDNSGKLHFVSPGDKIDPGSGVS